MEGENVEIVAHKTKKAFILNRYFSYNMKGMSTF